MLKPQKAYILYRENEPNFVREDFWFHQKVKNYLKKAKIFQKFIGRICSTTELIRGGLMKSNVEKPDRDSEPIYGFHERKSLETN